METKIVRNEIIMDFAWEFYRSLYIRPDFTLENEIFKDNGWDDYKDEYVEAVKVFDSMSDNIEKIEVFYAGAGISGRGDLPEMTAIIFWKDGFVPDEDENHKSFIEYLEGESGNEVYTVGCGSFKTVFNESY